MASLQEDGIVNRDAEAGPAVGKMMMYQAVVDEIETGLLEAGNNSSTTPGFACDSGVTVPTTPKPGNVRRGNEQV